MATQLVKLYLEKDGMKVNGIAFLPDPTGHLSESIAIMTHGYTSHKGSILNWATRLSDEGVPTLLFDQPGHYLGSFNEVPSFQTFKNSAHLFFVEAFHKLLELYQSHYPLSEHLIEEKKLKVLLMGHSLGGLMSLKAIENENLNSFEKVAVCVGLGINVTSKTHIFKTPFYKSTLNIREQLVSPELCSENVFPWLSQEKKSLNVKNQTIHFITGEDDLVVGPSGTEEIKNLLDNENTITIDKPKSLPHHQPELAASFIKKFLKNQNLI